MKTTPTPKRPAQAKARRIKADRVFGVFINGRLESVQMNPRPDDEWPLTPLLALPADPASLERMREQFAVAFINAFHGGANGIPNQRTLDATQAGFSALGLTARTGKKE